jgi:hypothetical protein
LLIGISGLGCIISLGKFWYYTKDSVYLSEFLSNLGTFSISIAVIACADTIIDDAQNKTMRLFIFVMTIISLLTAGFSICFVNNIRLYILTIITVIIAVLSAIICWVIVNYKRPVFYENNPVAALGGEIK